MRSAYDIFKSATNNASFYKTSVTFFSENPKEFSIYQGYKYNPVQNDSLIEKFNDHIKDVVCSGNIELYNYLQSW
jgi:hypothetical protein